MPLRFAAILAALLLAAPAPTRAQTVADFYKGKTINLVLGYGPRVIQFTAWRIGDFWIPLSIS